MSREEWATAVVEAEQLERAIERLVLSDEAQDMPRTALTELDARVSALRARSLDPAQWTYTSTMVQWIQEKAADLAAGATSRFHGQQLLATRGSRKLGADSSEECLLQCTFEEDFATAVPPGQRLVLVVHDQQGRAALCAPYPDDPSCRNEARAFRDAHVGADKALVVKTELPADVKQTVRGTWLAVAPGHARALFTIDKADPEELDEWFERCRPESIDVLGQSDIQLGID